VPLKPYFDSPEDMEVLSNKRTCLKDLFKLLDIDGIGRIDTFELFAVILLAAQGKIELKLSHTIGVFGFGSQYEFTFDECHFYFDCLFRGLLKLLIKKGFRKPFLPKRRVSHDDITNLVESIFPKDKKILDRDDFIEKVMNIEGTAILFETFSEKMETSIIKSRERALERMQVMQYVRKFTMDLLKNVNKVITEKEESAK